MVESLGKEEEKKEAPESAETDSGAENLEPGGSQEQGGGAELITMLTLEQLKRFGPRHVRIHLELRWPTLKRGGCVVPWGDHQDAWPSGSGGTCPSDQISGLSTQQGISP